jgi:hypothetical protein
VRVNIDIGLIGVIPSINKITKVGIGDYDKVMIDKGMERGRAISDLNALALGDTERPSFIHIYYHGQ